MIERLAIGIVVTATAVVLGILGYWIWYEVNDPGQGTITSKEYEPAHTTVQCTLSGKVTVCTPIYHGECYRVRYTDGHHDGDACVSQREYDGYSVGAHYPPSPR